MRRRRSAFAFISLTLLAACGGGDNGGGVTGPEVSRIDLSQTTLSLLPDDRVQLTATFISPTGTVISGATAQWRSSDTRAITVSASGEVTAVAPGSATITVEGGGMRATATARVNIPGHFALVQANGREPPTVFENATCPPAMAVRTGTYRVQSGNLLFDKDKVAFMLNTEITCGSERAEFTGYGQLLDYSVSGESIQFVASGAPVPANAGRLAGATITFTWTEAYGISIPLTYTRYYLPAR